MAPWEGRQRPGSLDARSGVASRRMLGARRGSYYRPHSAKGALGAPAAPGVGDIRR